jgi:putative RecB family exonuclease
LATYSHSRLKTFQQCPRKFLWQYVWNVRSATEGVEAFVGKRVHETLEELYLQVGREEPIPDLRSLVDDFHARWERHWSDSVRIVRDKRPDHYRDLGTVCLERYYQRHHPFDAGTTLGVEKSFLFPVEEGSQHRLRGVIDRIDLAEDGALEVHDYKTGRYVPSRRDLESDQQVAFYEAGARHLYPRYRRVRMVWHFLQAGVEHRLPAGTPQALSAMRRRTRAQIDTIEETVQRHVTALDVPAARALMRCSRVASAHVPEAARQPAALFPARVGNLCRWCSLLDWCREGSEHAGIPFRPPPEPVAAAQPPVAHEDLPVGGQGKLF